MVNYSAVSKNYVFDIADIANVLYMNAPDEYVISRSIGNPIPTRDCETAYVSLDENTKKITFFFNPDFAKSLSDEEIAFVVAHESRHVFLGHLLEKVSNEFEREDILMVAHECIINDYLEENTLLTPPVKRVSGIDLYGQSFADMTTREAYDYILSLEENQDDSQNDNLDDLDDITISNSGSGASSDSNSDNNSDSNSDSSDSSNGNSDGVSVQDIIDNVFGGSCSHSADNLDNVSVDDVVNAMQDVFEQVVSDISDDDVDISDDLMEKIADNTVNNIGGGYSPNGKNMGAVGVGEVLSDVSVNWREYLLRVNPDISNAGAAKKDFYSWSQPQRKLMESYPRVILPGCRDEYLDDNESRDGDIPTVILALDLSYSIPDKYIEDLVNMADSIPDEYIRVMPVTWSDIVVDFDPNTRKIVRRSGTNIDALWDYSQKVSQEVLDGGQPYVLVITDGDFNFGDNWCGYWSEYPLDTSIVRDYWNFALMDYSVNSSNFSRYNSRLSNDLGYDVVNSLTMDVDDLL